MFPSRIINISTNEEWLLPKNEFFQCADENSAIVLKVDTLDNLHGKLQIYDRSSRKIIFRYPGPVLVISALVDKSRFAVISGLSGFTEKNFILEIPPNKVLIFNRNNYVKKAEFSWEHSTVAISGKLNRTLLVNEAVNDVTSKGFKVYNDNGEILYSAMVADNIAGYDFDSDMKTISLLTSIAKSARQKVLIYDLRKVVR